MASARRVTDRPFDATVFDLFGTLVPEFGLEAFRESVAEIARRLDAPADAFWDAWGETAIERQTGLHARIEDTVLAICAMLRVPVPTEDQLAWALAPRADMYARGFHPRPGVVETLRELRRRVYPTALVSMCAPDTPALWRASELAGLVDVEVFSCEVGMRKPDPAIYRYALDRLGIPAERALYVGDGAYGELTGAEAVGMTAYLLRDLAVDRAAQLIPERDAWSKRSIGDLRELLGLLA